MPPRLTGITSAMPQEEPENRMHAVFAGDHPVGNAPQRDLHKERIDARTVIADDDRIPLALDRELPIDFGPPHDSGEEMGQQPEETSASRCTAWNV